MNISREQLDSLNAVVKVDIEKSDYTDQVEKILTDYRKTANVPGFRKGHVPMGMVRKQYGKAVLVDEVNKLLQDALNKYLSEEKLDVLGSPIPKPQDDLDWNAEHFTFEFELGLTPKFEVDLKPKKPIVHYQIVVENSFVDEQIANLQKQYGSLVPQEKVEEDSELYGTFSNEEHTIEKDTSVKIQSLKDKSSVKKLMRAKLGDRIELRTKNLFKDNFELMNALGVNHDKALDLDIVVQFEIKEINKRIMAELDQEFFDKLYQKGTITNVTELKARIKEDTEKQYAQQSDQKLLSDVSDHLLNHTKFDLPAEFLTKWLKTSGDEPMNDDQAKEAYEQSERALRYQLIEGKLMETFSLRVDFEDLKARMHKIIRDQMAQFGQPNPSEKELDDISARLLGNKDEVRRLTEQVVNQKLLDLYKEQCNLKTKKVNFKEFIELAYNKR